MLMMLNMTAMIQDVRILRLGSEVVMTMMTMMTTVMMLNMTAMIQDVRVLRLGSAVMTTMMLPIVSPQA